MAKIDFTKLSFEDIQRLKEQADERLKELSQEKMAALFAEFKKTCEDAGFTAHEVLKGRVRNLQDPSEKQQKKRPIKFRDPENPSNTYAGLGPVPKWLQEKEAAGHKREEFLVDKPTPAAEPVAVQEAKPGRQK